MPVVTPDASAEKLRQLLAEQHESPTLDFKSACDLSERRDVVELAKDVAAMAANGGYIVIGADDRGQPTGAVSDDHTRLFDEATLRAKLTRYLPEPLDLLCAAHEIDTKRLICVYIGRSPVGFVVMKATGQYTDAKGRQVFVFRAGDVFVRHGTASERWQQEDIEPLIARVVAERREAWRAEIADELRGQLERATQLQQSARTGPAELLTWQLDAGTFRAVVVEQLRSGDDIPIRLLLQRVVGDADGLVDAGDVDDLETLLDRLSTLGGLFLLLDRQEWLEQVTRALIRIYDLGFGAEGFDRQAAVPSARLWLSVIERVYALGALAVRLERWHAVRNLTLQAGSGYDFRERYPYWLRHAVTMAARANLLSETVGDQRRQLSLLSLAKEHLDRVDDLRPDARRGDGERLLDSLCQFDFLSALATIADSERATTRIVYPNFARFRSHRTEPMAIRVLRDREMREIVFPLDDDDLATALRALLDLASREPLSFMVWDGFESDEVRAFLEEHPERATA